MKSNSVLLYPQTLLLPEIAEELKNYFKKLIILKLPTTEEHISQFFSNFEFFEFLEIRGIDEKFEQEIKKEITNIETWGLFFRTPETLKYFAQYKEVLQDSLEQIIPYLKKAEVQKEGTLKKQIDFKQALLILCLAESLDSKLLDVKTGLKKIEKKYQEVIKEKIIGEELGKFSEIQNVMESSEDRFQLLNLPLRISAWKKLFSYLNPQELKENSQVLITERTLLQDWIEDFEIIKEEKLSDFLRVFFLKASIPQLLKVKQNSGGFSENTAVYFAEIV